MDTKIIKAICILIMAFGAIGPWIGIALYGILKISYGMMLAVIMISVIVTFLTQLEVDYQKRQVRLAAAKYIHTLGGKEYTNNLTSSVYQICHEMSRK